MNSKKNEKYVLLIVVVIGLLGLCALFSSALQHADVTGAAIRKPFNVLCSDSDDNHPERKGAVKIHYGSQFFDQCYIDKTASENPSNIGTYLREYICDGDSVSYTIYSCGTNKCQYGACIGEAKKLS
jgi:hypothetical protein